MRFGDGGQKREKGGRPKLPETRNVQMDTEQHYCSNQDSQKFYIHLHLSVTEFIILLCSI